ncbi:hypothetical protein GCM10017161_27640 [Thalassotalea marina]|uniref:Secreted protein n=1 Tax=Thalassotalea marina TaxID=1673741 RepID=A0A919BMP5_9GAMM|nr:hypothetical protein GCM10017161_27640 [Thalassotalea marina]
MLKFKILLGTCGIVALSAFAAVHQWHIYTYYADASMSVEVGQRITSCGTINDRVEGQTTPYYKIVSEDCDSVPGDQDYCSEPQNVMLPACNIEWPPR